MNSDFSAFVPDVHFELIAIKNLVSNQEYQRNLSLIHVQRTVNHFDLRQINPVKVSRREGLNYVFDGQHTVESIASVSGSRDTPTWCMVYDDLDYEVEADIFANQQKHTRPLNAYDVFKASIEAGKDDHIVIKKMVESYGLIVSSRWAPGCIGAANCLVKIYQKYGYHLLDRVIRLCVLTWEGDQTSLSANMLNAVARMVSTYGEDLKDEAFSECVGMYSAREISRSARERRAGSLGFAEALLAAYNKKAKPGLPWAKLYSGKLSGTVHAEEDDTSAFPPVRIASSV